MSDKLNEKIIRALATYFVNILYFIHPQNPIEIFELVKSTYNKGVTVFENGVTYCGSGVFISASWR